MDSSSEQKVKAQGSCSFIDQPEMSVSFFNKAKLAYAGGHSVLYDLSDANNVTETFAAVLISQIKDRNINQGRISKVVFPTNLECAKKLKKLGLYKRFGNESEEIDSDSIPVQKVTSLLVANNIAKAMVRASAHFLYGDDRKIKELYAILIEIMANTNNHASNSDVPTHPWWLFRFFDETRNVVKYIFLDNGVGIFDSIPVKQFMIRSPLPVLNQQAEITKYQRGLQLEEVFTNLSSGRIKSSTGLPQRGRGIPLVTGHAKSEHFNKFLIVSNDAYIDVITGDVSPMNENFSGTLFYFEIKRVSE